MMEYTISKSDIKRWCSIPSEELANHPDRKCDIFIRDTKAEVFRQIADEMAEELIEHNKKGELTKWILPSGHLEQFALFAERVNREDISVKNLHIFHMDDWLDWQFKPMPADHKVFVSARSIMKEAFYGLFDDDHQIPMENRHWPEVNDPDAIDDLIEKMGGIDMVMGGVGARGMIAFDEPPRSRYYKVSLEEYANSKTRMTMINEDTIVAYAQRVFGGCYEAIPPCGITIGMKSILTAKRGMFVVMTGDWKQTVIRIALFSEETTEFPITIPANRLPKLTIYTDAHSADHPILHRADCGYLDR